MTYRPVFFAISVALMGLLPACAANVVTESVDRAAPQLGALSTYRASLGDVVRAVGADIPEGADHFLRFEGTFDGADSVSETVSLREPVRRVDSGLVEWERFGPYDLPFSRLGARTGMFHGTVALESELEDGTLLTSEPLTIEFEVAPSLIVRDFQPIMASCARPATVAIGEIPYRLDVEAIGISPVQYNYVFATPTLDGTEPMVERHLRTASTDSLGDRGDFVLPAVPEGRQFYSLIVAIEATDASGQVVRNAFAVEVHRPIELYYNGNIEIAEILPAQPVSACMPGGDNGREVTYDETQVETRMRAYEIGWNETWRASHSVSEGSSTTVGATVTNGIGYGISNTNSVTWSVGSEISTEVGASGTFGISQLISVGVSGKVGTALSTERSETNSTTTSASAERTEGVSASRTTTNTETSTTEEGGGRSEGFQWSVSSSESIGRGFGGTIIAGRFGVFYRQTMRLVRRAALVSYNLCGAPEVVGEVDFTDWAWAADLAQSDACPPLPASNLPEAVCYEEPCVE